ncbi:MAG: FAD-dependent oxidoreductase [Thermoguttaceae bacterium]|jgi:predicted NAD/FAD-binding protein|nr:FAD-dependent oxidoreductase [Thermoguttaceae bacterium]
MKIAVIGSGISGLLSARLLAAEHEVHVFEANGYAGGHTNTVEFEVFGRRYAADTGFMVFNDRTYPNFVEMLRTLNVPARWSDMSFSVRCDRTGLEYQGSSLNGLFAQRRNLLRPSFYRMLLNVLRFNRRSLELLRGDEEELTLGQYLDRNRYSRQFIEHYLVPMGAAIWSAPPDRFLQFPARFIVNFFNNHGLLTVRGHPRWKTVEGGAVRYVEALTPPFADRIRLNCPVVSVRRFPDRVAVTWQNGGPEDFDAAVLAAHSDQSLGMLADANPAEQEILGAIGYQRNETVLHIDPALLPRCRRAWASWNYCIPPEPGRPVVLTYNLNRLQGHSSPAPICVTLNATQSIDAGMILRQIEYHHPVYSREALAAQKRFGEINGRNRTYFCGAYWGHGFHEDGVNSALAVGQCFGVRMR